MRVTIHGFLQDNVGGAFSNPPQGGNVMPLALDFNGSIFSTLVIGSGFNKFPLVGVSNADDDVIETGDPINLPVVNYPYLYDGATFERARCASANNFNPASALPKGVAMMARPGEWSQGNRPGAGAIASTSKVAGAAGVRHVCTSISATLNCVGAIAAPIALRLRDGATGVGAILWEIKLTGLAGTTVIVSMTGLNIVGFPATAMTLEFAAAGGAGDFQCVNFTGYDVAA